MAQIQVNWTKSGQNLGIGGHSIGLRGQNGGPHARILGHFAWIQAIMLGFGPFCLDLGHMPWIWAIWLEFGPFGRIWVRIGSKEDKALRIGWGGDGSTDICTDRLPLCSTGLPPLWAAALLQWFVDKLRGEQAMIWVSLG